MIRLLLVTVVPFTLAACALAPQPAPPDGVRRVSFSCANGESVEMRFFPQQGVGVLVRNGKTAELQQSPAASGFRYTGSGIEVRGKGDELTIDAVGAATVQCQARN